MNDNEHPSHWLVHVLRRCFALLCIFATLTTVTLQFHKYGKGEDETQVEYKKFNEGESDIYPSVGLCLTMAINEERLKKYGENFTSEQYVSFLTGTKYDWNKEMLKVDYENVMQHWNEYILGYGYLRGDNWEWDILYFSKEIDPTSSGIMSGSREFSMFGMKCLAIDILFKKELRLFKFALFLKPEVFLQGIRRNPRCLLPINTWGFHLLG